MSLVITIEIYCANPSHARGKVAEIGRFIRGEHGAWDLTPRRRRARGGDAPYQCNLCGRRLPVDPRDHIALFAALDHLAAQRVSRAELFDFLVLASKAKR
jgi:hypothetical protein